MRTLNDVAVRLCWLEASGRELVFAVIFIHLISTGAALVRLLAPGTVLVGFAAFALWTYYGVTSPGEYGVRPTLGWVGAPSLLWVAAAVAGTVLGLSTTAVTAALGHSTRIVEPVHNQILAVTLAPIFEEICLRGLILPLLASRIGDTRAVLVSSLIFAFMHWPASLQKLISIALLGVAYGSIRTRTGSTALAAITHTAYNASVLTLGLIHLA